MIEEIFFQDEGRLTITAASVGLSHQRWAFTTDEEVETKSHLKVMRENRFDVLPIVGKNGKTVSYVKTRVPNEYSQTEVLPITYEDTLQLDSNIREVIDLFDRTNRNFFFLTFKNEVKGLITIGNLNCRQVQVLLFSLICELERSLEEFLYYCLSEAETIAWAKSKVDDSREDCKYRLMLATYEQLISLDLENKFTEHFYFVDLLNIITEKGLYNEFGLSRRKWTHFNSINEIRKRVAHPNRSLIDNENTVKKLNQRLTKIDKLLFMLKNR
ncbi:MAG: hypothetical protein AAGI38_10175 [Bacteroidota bacterium]